jgi:hypothetical protein
MKTLVLFMALSLSLSSFAQVVVAKDTTITIEKSIVSSSPFQFASALTQIEEFRILFIEVENRNLEEVRSKLKIPAGWEFASEREYEKVAVDQHIFTRKTSGVVFDQEYDNGNKGFVTFNPWAIRKVGFYEGDADASIPWIIILKKK